MKMRIKQIIERIEKDGGIIILSEDLDDFIALDRLMDQEEDATALARIDLLQRPVPVGNLLLCRLSWGAVEWLRECAGAWWQNDPDMYALAMIYAHCHANKPAAFISRMAVDCRHARRKIKEFMRSVPESVEAISAAIELIHSQNSPPPEENEPPKEASGEKETQHADMLARLCREYGRPPEFFLYEMSQDMLDLYIQRMIDREAEEFDRLARLHDQKVQTNPDTAQSLAFRRVAMKTKQITAKCMKRKKGTRNA